jgi:hypothetical protein
MFWAWKDTILSHYSVLSGKGLMNEKHIFSANLSLHHSKLFPRPLQPRRRPTAKKFWAIEQWQLRPFVRRLWLCQEAVDQSIFSAHFTRWHYRGGSVGLSNQSVGDGVLGVGPLVCEAVTRIDLLRGITVIAHKPERIR